MTLLTGGLKRREFLQKLFSWGALLLSYGTIAGFAGRFLYPSGHKSRRKMYLTSLANLPVGKATTFSTPTGDKVILANTIKGLKAFSTRCPHLGCQILWRDKKQDFFCPCHNGLFDIDGMALEGPPAKEGTNMKTVKVKVEGESIFAWI